MLYVKNRSKWRWFSGPEPRHTVDGSEKSEIGLQTGKMAYDHETSPTATERWSTRPLPPIRKRKWRKRDLVRKPRQNMKEPRSLEARLAAETPQPQNEHNMRHYQVLNR